MSDTTDIQILEMEGLPWNDTNVKWCLQNLECTSCGRCCRDLTEGVKVSYDDAKELARYLRISNKEFYQTVKKYPDYCVMAQPCHFLKNNRCTVHAKKPTICLMYPLYYRKESPWLTIATCPAGQKLIDTLLRNSAKTAPNQESTVSAGHHDENNPGFKV
jgi:Fe-S-cluster containining protein